ncbi:iron-containing alcohol dehydrogenase [Fredinandcohnia sp. FSL W7-1320]|uniref:iron-containing alcohol dehydrogenase n=1 Tax=Fredinandcohnia sp. FSL W7-1320 TaxID=2954540 RepID=UPI0030FD3094
MPKAIFYGRNSFMKVGEVVSERGKRALIISDKIMDKLGYVNQCQEYLHESGISYSTFLDVNSEPTDNYVVKALELFSQTDCDVIVALGGGSCIDTAKAVAVLAKNEGDISEYIGNKKVAKNGATPLIAIPTTAGTGSEATDVTVITNTETDVKMMIKQPAFMPDVAIVDPLLTLSSPKNITAATGVDALTHAIEAYISKRSHPLTDTFALSAIKLIFDSIQRAYQNGEDIEAREMMSLGALKAGIAFSNSSVCLVHGMSRPIGAIFHVPHGVSNAMLLPAVLEFSMDECYEKLAEIGRYLNPEMKGLAKKDIAINLVREVKRLCMNLNIPNMKEWGIDIQAMNKVVKKMAKDSLASGSPANNPKIPTEDEIEKLYQICYNYNMKEEIQI